jgi:hypothetical protein
MSTENALKIIHARVASADASLKRWNQPTAQVFVTLFDTSLAKCVGVTEEIVETRG